MGGPGHGPAARGHPEGARGAPPVGRGRPGRWARQERALGSRPEGPAGGRARLDNPRDPPSLGSSLVFGFFGGGFVAEPPEGGAAHLFHAFREGFYLNPARITASDSKDPDQKPIKVRRNAIK